MQTNKQEEQHSISRIHVSYKGFQKIQRDIWESFCVVEFYVPHIKSLLMTKKLPPLESDRIWSSAGKSLDSNNTLGALSSLSDKANYRRTLLEAVLVFEDYISDLISDVYTDYPMKLLSDNNNADSEDSKAGYQKLLRLMLECSDKNEMIDRLIEEKVRGIFYGNPLDVFLKDKAKLEFGTYFKIHHKDDIDKLKKVIAVRNIIAHNNGKIDRKYIREADPQAQLGRVLKIDKDFIKDSVYVLSLLAAHATRLVIENIYKGKIGGNLKKAIDQFKKGRAMLTPAPK